VTALPQHDILVVEDEPIVRSVMSHVLTASGYSVTCAENGEAALAALDQNQFRAVVCDIHMPVLDGVRFFEALEERNADLAKRVLFVTAVGNAPSVADFFARKKCRVLEKPYELRKLLENVSFLVGRPPAREMLF
jgi:two-component system response regulator GlrR